MTQAGREHPGQPALMRLAVGATGRLRKDGLRVSHGHRTG
jgi:hypothetical protein